MEPPPRAANFARRRSHRMARLALAQGFHTKGLS